MRESTCLSVGGLGIAVCDLSGHCVEEEADTTLCLILDMYRRTYWLARDVGFCQRRVTCPEQLFELAYGATRIRGQTLGIVGFGSCQHCCLRYAFVPLRMHEMRTFAIDHLGVSACHATSRSLSEQKIVERIEVLFGGLRNIVLDGGPEPQRRGEGDSIRPSPNYLVHR